MLTDNCSTEQPVWCICQCPSVYTWNKISLILSLRLEALTSFSKKAKQKVIRILHFNHRKGITDPVQWPSPPSQPWSMLFNHTRTENIQLDFSIFFWGGGGEGKGRWGIFNRQCSEQLYPETRLSNVHFPWHYCSRLKVLVKKVFRHPVLVSL